MKKVVKTANHTISKPQICHNGSEIIASLSIAAGTGNSDVPTWTDCSWSWRLFDPKSPRNTNLTHIFVAKNLREHIGGQINLCWSGNVCARLKQFCSCHC